MKNAFYLRSILWIFIFHFPHFVDGQSLTAPPNNAASKPSFLQSLTQRISIYGFTRFDFFHNTRRNFDLRDGVIQFHPLDATNLPIKNADNTLSPNPNDDGNNIGQSGFSAIVTQLGFNIDGGTYKNLTISAKIETDFFGITNTTSPVGGSGGGTEHLLRLLNAYVELKWPKTKLIIGQHWNPGFLPNNYPGVGNFLTGIPSNPFGYVPQVRLKQKLYKDLSVMGMIFLYSSAGFSPAGGFQTNPRTPGATGVDIVRFAKYPAFALQLEYETPKLLLGTSVEGVTLRPHIHDYFNPNTQRYSDNNNNNNLIQKNITTNLFTVNYFAYAKITLKNLQIKLYSLYGQARTQYAGMGGFAEYRKAHNGAWAYVSLNQLNTWAEFIFTKSKMFEPAVYMEYTRNLGLARPIYKKNIAPGTNPNFIGVGVTNNTPNQFYPNAHRGFAYMAKISPRLSFYYRHLKIVLEYEYNPMLFGDLSHTFNNNKIYDYKVGAGALARPFTAVNNRFIVVVVYQF